MRPGRIRREPDGSTGSGKLGFGSKGAPDDDPPINGGRWRWRRLLGRCRRRTLVVRRERRRWWRRLGVRASGALFETGGREATAGRHQLHHDPTTDRLEPQPGGRPDLRDDHRHDHAAPTSTPTPRHHRPLRRSAATGVHCASATQCTATSPPGPAPSTSGRRGRGPQRARLSYVPAPVPILTFKQLLAPRSSDRRTSGVQVVASAADRAALAGVDLRGVNLTGVSFLGEPVDLTGTHLDGATLTGTNLAPGRLDRSDVDQRQCRRGDLRGRRPLSRGSSSRRQPLGANTNLQSADFVNADVSGAKFVGADLTGAVFSGARGVDTDFTGVRARNAVFSDAHLYGNGQAFHGATDLANVDFTGAVMASDVNESGGFDFTGAPLTGPTSTAPCAWPATSPTPRQPGHVHRRLPPRGRSRRGPSCRTSASIGPGCTAAAWPTTTAPKVTRI